VRVLDKLTLVLVNTRNSDPNHDARRDQGLSRPVWMMEEVFLFGGLLFGGLLGFLLGILAGIEIERGRRLPKPIKGTT